MLIVYILAAIVAAHLLIVVFAGIAALMIPKGPVKRQYPICRAVVRVLAPVVNFYAGVSAKVIGEEKLPQGERYLMVCNHRSVFDPIVALQYLYRHNISFVMKPMVDKLPIVNSVSRGLGCLTIDRENDRAALKTILQTTDYIKRGVCSMGIYPEGTRNHGSGLLEFRAGAFKAAQRAGSAVVVAVVRGTEQLKKNWPWRRTRVELEIVEVIPAEEVQALHTHELSEKCRELMLARLEESNG